MGWSLLVKHRVIETFFSRCSVHWHTTEELGLVPFISWDDSNLLSCFFENPQAPNCAGVQCSSCACGTAGKQSMASIWVGASTSRSGSLKQINYDVSNTTNKVWFCPNNRPLCPCTSSDSTRVNISAFPLSHPYDFTSVPSTSWGVLFASLFLETIKLTFSQVGLSLGRGSKELAVQRLCVVAKPGFSASPCGSQLGILFSHQLPR